MNSISNVPLGRRVLLVNVDREEHFNAAFVTYSESNGYAWLADADVTELQLDGYPSVLKYLQHSDSSLELSYSSNEMIKAEITCMQRVGGYKEPFHRVIRHSCMGLDDLEKVLSAQLKSQNLESDPVEKGFQIKMQQVNRKEK